MTINHIMRTNTLSALHAIEASSLRFSSDQGPEPVEVDLLALNFVAAHQIGATDSQIAEAAREFIINSGSLFSFQEEIKREIDRSKLAVRQAANVMQDKEPHLKALAQSLKEIAGEAFKPKTARQRALLQLTRACREIRHMLSDMKSHRPFVKNDHS